MYYLGSHAPLVSWILFLLLDKFGVCWLGFLLCGEWMNVVDFNHEITPDPDSCDLSSTKMLFLMWKCRHGLSPLRGMTRLWWWCATSRSLFSYIFCCVALSPNVRWCSCNCSCTSGGVDKSPTPHEVNALSSKDRLGWSDWTLGNLALLAFLAFPPSRLSPTLSLPLTHKHLPVTIPGAGLMHPSYHRNVWG